MHEVDRTKYNSGSIQQMDTEREVLLTRIRQQCTAVEAPLAGLAYTRVVLLLLLSWYSYTELYRLLLLLSLQNISIMSCVQT